MRAITIVGHDDTVTGVTVRGARHRRNPGSGWPSGNVVDALVSAFDARDVTITHCDVSGGIEDGIGAFATDGMVVEDNHIHDNGTNVAGAVGIAVSDTSHAVAADNVIDRNTAAGVRVDRASSSDRITGNVIEGNAKEGIVVAGTHVTVSGNQVDGNGAMRFAAISLHGARATVVSANVVRSNHYAGIAVDNGGGGPATGITLVANTVTGNGHSPADQISVQSGEGVNPDWSSANTFRVGPPSGWWPPRWWPFAVAGSALVACALVLQNRRQRATTGRQHATTVR
jgi:parallel beta-helix repeat protein